MEILLTAAALATEPVDPPPSPTSEEAPPPATAEPIGLAAFDWHQLVDHDLWSEVPPDIDAVLGLLLDHDLYVQDEVEVRLHPTLTRLWSRRGRRGQRLVRAPGQNRRFVGFGAIDWRDGWLSIGYGLGRTAEVFCQQLDHLVEHSQSRGRKALVLLDNLRIHTPEGSKLLRETFEKHGDKLLLVYTPRYDPEANPTERLWSPFRLAVTHNHHRDNIISLYQDTYQDTMTYFGKLDADPNLVLTHIGSPFASTQTADRSTSTPTPSLAGRS